MHPLGSGRGHSRLLESRGSRLNAALWTRNCIGPWQNRTSPEPISHLEQTIISEREKPALDEETFQQLLEAAHVLQEQKAFEVANRPRPNPAEALAEIVETQEFLRSQASDLQVAANVIVERLQKITHASGVAVAVVREDRLEYCAATGDAAQSNGNEPADGFEPLRGWTALHRIQP